MPAKYFFKFGFKVATKRGEEAILWKKFNQTAKTPRFRVESYKYLPVKGKVIIDLFWNTFCQPSDVEAQRVREIVKEFGDDVILNEYSADNIKIIQKYGISRRIYINGKIIEVCSEIDKKRLRQEIKKAQIN